jgi:hypothetical protein
MENCQWRRYVPVDFPVHASPHQHQTHSFPAFPHDVAWNHALCKLKDVVEDEESSLANQRFPSSVLG